MKDRIIKSNKRREIDIKDKTHRAALEHVHIQRMTLQATESSRAINFAVESF